MQRFSNRRRSAKSRPRPERYRPCLWSLEDRLCLSLTLTQAGQDAGLVLSTFASGFPNAGAIGPYGIAFPDSGGVLVTDRLGNVRLLPTDTDGQGAAGSPPGQNYGIGNAVGLAQVGSAIYMAQTIAGRVVQINADGTFNRVVATVPSATGMVADPANGHLFISAYPHRLIDVNPVTGKAVAFVDAGAVYDGLTISGDGHILYAKRADGQILGFDTGSYKVVYNSGFIPGNPDGVAEGIGPLAGNLFVNCNNGTVVEINISTNQQTLIASGGSRGDFVTVDPHDGSVLLTQTDRIIRMTFPFGLAHHLSVGGFPATVFAGTPGKLTVSALDQNGQVAADYTGTVHFTSSDSQAQLAADYTFTAADRGTHVFTITLATVGNQTITATDTTDPRLTGTQGSIAVGPATARLYALGGAPGHVQVHRVNDNSTVADFAPYGAAYTGGVSVAIGDVDGDGYPDLVTGATVGNPQVKIFNGKAFSDGSFNPSNPDASLLASFFAYGLNFNVGANVAVGDINHDGFADVVTGATVGNPQVKVYDGQAIAHHTFDGNNPDASLLASFFAYGLQFNIGANVAVGDVSHDGFADIVTGPTAGNPQVKVYDGQAIANRTFDNGNPDASLLTSFFAFGLQFNVGAFVAVGDVNGDGFGDVIVGATRGNPQVNVYSGQAIAQHTFDGGNPNAGLLTTFYAFLLGEDIGVSVAATNFDASGQAEILTGAAQGAPRYRLVRGLSSGIQPPADHGIDGVVANILGGILVGA
jgi:hypothetical protein